MGVDSTEPPGNRLEPERQSASFRILVAQRIFGFDLLTSKRIAFYRFLAEKGKLDEGHDIQPLTQIAFARKKSPLT